MSRSQHTLTLPTPSSYDLAQIIAAAPELSAAAASGTLGTRVCRWETELRFNVHPGQAVITIPAADLGSYATDARPSLPIGPALEGG